ncbi:hypothetical protein ACT453_12345, partial [Bacillus sp. D-CC]
MKRKRGLPSYPGSRVLYVVLTIISMLEAFSIIAQTVFLARAITPLLIVFSVAILFFQQNVPL